MDLISIDGEIVVAGPDTRAHPSGPHAEAVGVRFRPGVLPRLLSVPAAELRDLRVPLAELRPELAGASPAAAAMRLLLDEPTACTAPWTLPLLRQITTLLSAGAPVGAVADEAGYSARNLRRQCIAVFGYPPATLRRVLRFRRALAMVRSGMPTADAAARAGYADQPHLHREVRDLAGVPLSQLGSAANRSIDVPSGSVTVA